MPGILPFRLFLKSSSRENKAVGFRHSLEPVMTQKTAYEVQRDFFRVDTSRIFMIRWGGTPLLDSTARLGKVAVAKQARFADSAADKVVSAWVPPIDFSGLASLMDLLHQERLTHIRNVEQALSTETEPGTLEDTLFEERIWIAGYDQLIDFLGQGPDCLVRAHEQGLLIFQGRSINETRFKGQYDW